MNARYRPLRVFLCFLLLSPAIATGARVWREGLAAPSIGQSLLLGLLPLLAWIGWRHISVFGCREACHPGEEGTPARRCRAS